MSLTLQDVLDLTPEQIIQKVVSQPPEEDDSLSYRKRIVDAIKTKLKGYFANDPDLLVRGQTLRINKKFVVVSGILNSSGRVFLRVEGDKKEFSLSKNYLLGVEEQKLPYQQGDTVVVEGMEYIVCGVNPASRNVRIKRSDGFVRSINVNKINKEELTS